MSKGKKTAQEDSSEPFEPAEEGSPQSETPKADSEKCLPSKPKFKLPRGALIATYVFPVVITATYYVLRQNPDAMGWASINISSPVRKFSGVLTSVFPFSVTELLIAAAIVWLIYYLVKTAAVTVRRRNKLKIISKRLLLVVVAALYFWGVFCWVWNSGYHAPGFAERNGFTRSGVAAEDLITVTRLFAGRANDLASIVARDESGRFNENRSELYAASTEIYKNIASEFACLEGGLHRPKPMIYSWLMSRTGYSGMYFALTGEANINNMMPSTSLPATLAHEHAHHLGVFAEDEANFVGILACILSGNTAFAYSGYLSGLNHLLNALAVADANAWIEITHSLSDEVYRDRQDSFDFWSSQRIVDTGVGFVDTALTAVTGAVRDTVDAAYDSFLRSQNQELGLQSYGACVDLLVEYFAPNP